MSSDDDFGEDLYCDIPVVRHHPFHNRQDTSTNTTNNQSESQSVADHYNSRPNQIPSDRHRSSIIHLRDFNNWTKSVLIREFVSQGNLKVLDLACGKGGDLFKWDKASVTHVTGVGKTKGFKGADSYTIYPYISIHTSLDIAQVSVDHAKERYNNMRGASFDAKFICYDAFNVN